MLVTRTPLNMHSLVKISNGLSVHVPLQKLLHNTLSETKKSRVYETKLKT